MPQGPFNTLVAKIVGSTAYSALSQGKQGDLLNSKLHGDKYSQAYQNNLFWGANQTGIALSNALATTYTGLCLSNPAASTRNLVVRAITGALVVVPGAVGSLGLITGFAAGGVTVHTTPATIGPVSSQIGGTAVAQAKLDLACTIVGTPAWNRMLAVSKVSAEAINFSEAIEGGIILIPGAYCAIGSVLAAGPAVGFYGSMEWEEVAP